MLFRFKRFNNIRLKASNAVPLFWATLQCVFASLFVWSTITAFYFQYLEYNIWAVFFVGVPVQIALILGAKLRRAGVHWLRR